MKKLFFLSVIASLILSLFACKNYQDENNNKNQNTQTELIVFHAGSLSVPFKQMAEEYEKLNPNVKIFLEAAGSVASARKLTDLNRYCDIFASADYKVIDDMLIPEYADFNIKFASNEMAIVYTEKSKYETEINENNWYQILMKEDVHYGRSNPDADPCGYRAVLVSKLSETFYKKPGFSDKLLAKDNQYIRPKETDLLALLETSAIDYIFLYRSVAQQHKLKYIVLPDSINLKKFELKEFYNTVETQINGKVKGEIITQKGEPMVYGITMHKNAVNKKEAMNFMKFILTKGQTIMENNGQASLIPSKSDTFDKIPDDLKEFATK
ncbi:MAG: tungstate ABC transporter substrate-binding protein WtpA [Bacteroidales bacterium]|nr:tungstate ABC transporter substrate-binding protein WtpA [Bacteroidales bacterium]MBN2757414.1 tungstate ABC transporter substrate-binding protein WtpA [Bacteroidales bacterium]